MLFLNRSFVIFCFSLFACVPQKREVDKIYYNALIFNTDIKPNAFFRGALAMRGTEIIAIDSTHKILLNYDAPLKEDLDLNRIYPLSEKDTFSAGKEIPFIIFHRNTKEIYRREILP